jgi:hypothetical protein
MTEQEFFELAVELKCNLTKTFASWAERDPEPAVKDAWNKDIKKQLDAAGLEFQQYLESTDIGPGSEFLKEVKRRLEKILESTDIGSESEFSKELKRRLEKMV